MKGVKGRILKKLVSIPQVAYLTQPRIVSDENFSVSNSFRKIDPEPNEIDVSDLLSDEEEDDENSSTVRKGTITCHSIDNNKENIRPKILDAGIKIVDRSPELKWNSNSKSFRRPDFNSSTLFDPGLLCAFRQAVMEARNRHQPSDDEDESPPQKILKTEEVPIDPLLEFEDRFPPGGNESIILYTTSLRGIRKTFEDCRSVKLLLKNLRVSFHERDVSMHMEFRDELWGVLGGRAIPPRLFVKGRYIGGADEVLGLHEQRLLLPLVMGMPVDNSGGVECEGCGGIGFVVCKDCSGSRKIYDDDGVIFRCCCCNENGLVLCPLCC